MSELTFYDWMLICMFAVAAPVAGLLLLIRAPYGRHFKEGWGAVLPSTLGWVVMETPAVVTIAVFFFTSDRILAPVSMALFAMWQMHYLNRTYVFPFRRRGTKDRPMPVIVVVSALVFNVWNGYLNGAWLFHFGPYRDVSWLADPRFVVGAALFFAGMFINRQSDSILFGLRRPGESGYRIPRGGLYRYVSMPNYFGEILEWTGWAVATWSLAGLAFAVFTAANLVPRALANHRWYKETFADYPANRKAVIPFVL